MIQPDDYVLTLSTGERTEFSEFAYERIPVLGEEKALAAIEDVLRGCAVMERQPVEEAKRGYDVELRKALRMPVTGLLKIARPACRHLGTCVMADPRVCTARNTAGKKRIPPCWEHSSDPGELQEVVTAIVLAWSAGRKVIVVVPARTPRSAPSAVAPRGR